MIPIQIDCKFTVRIEKFQSFNFDSSITITKLQREKTF
jgi:hypothetical protein